MCRPASTTWSYVLPKIQGMWPGKKVWFHMEYREEAYKLRELVFNVALTIRPRPKLKTRLETDPKTGGLALMVEKISSKRG